MSKQLMQFIWSTVIKNLTIEEMHMLEVHYD